MNLITLLIRIEIHSLLVHDFACTTSIYLSCISRCTLLHILLEFCVLNELASRVIRGGVVVDCIG